MFLKTIKYIGKIEVIYSTYIWYNTKSIVNHILTLIFIENDQKLDEIIVIIVSQAIPYVIVRMTLKSFF